MGCLFSLKSIIKSKQTKSAPVLKTEDILSYGSAADVSLIKASSSVPSMRGIPVLQDINASGLRVFTFTKLRRATNDFSRTLQLGEGGFGVVYKGLIKPVDDDHGDRVAVAIKKLNKDGFQGHKQWLTEVHCLGVVEHPNLVKLIGYCADDGTSGFQRLLVYEFMTNKTLDDHLFSKAYPVLPWKTRLHIALGAAKGLVYLHEGLELQIIYRDFKASNVLLDDAFNPKLSDFGLAREGPVDGHTHISTDVMGTHGYAAPDYIETGRLTAKSDVWSFGVVLYELVTGRRSLDRNRPKGKEQKLVEWVKLFPADGRRFGQIIDQRLNDPDSVTSSARRVAKLADRCLAKNGRQRADMSEIVKGLEEIIADLVGPAEPVETVVEPEDAVVKPEEAVVEPEEAVVEPEEADVEPEEAVVVSDSAKRRAEQLTKLGTHVGGLTRKGLILMQRSKVT